MFKSIIGLTVLTLYFLVIAVSISEGPLISLQSLLLGLIGFVVITFFASSIARTINLVDIPDSFRKRHRGQVPLVGGVVIYISVIYGMLVFGINPFYRIVIISLIPIIIIGILDGIGSFKMPSFFRLIAQIIASWIVIFSSDIYLTDLGNLFGFGMLNLNQFGIPFTIFAVVGVCNAFNMLDGRDGLTSSVAVTVISGLLILLFLNGIIFNLGLILILSLFVFLVFNMSLLGEKNKIFLGEHGSSGLGHIIAWNLVYLSQENIIAPVTAIWFIFVPLTDTLLTIIRRIRTSKPIMQADRGHIHHVLSDEMGLSGRLILLVIVFISILTVSLAVLSNYLNFYEYYLFYFYLTILIIFMISGYTNHKKS